jgi:phage-related protein
LLVPPSETWRRFPQPSAGKSGIPFLSRSSETIPPTPSLSRAAAAGVLEIRDNYDGDTYRAVYTVRLEGVLYALHSFQKKSTKGIATPQRHIDLIKQRLREAEAIHKATKGVRS